jgi:hypothetical protein
VTGNNDGFPDYQLPIGPSELLNTEFLLWNAAGFLTEANGQTFLNGGYYSQDFGNGLKVICLNTVSESSFGIF